MSNTVKVFLICFSLSISPLFIILIIFLNAYTGDGVIVKDNASIGYIQTDAGDYYLVTQDSVDKGYFDENTYHRLTRTIDFDYDYIEKIKIFNTRNPLAKYAQLTLNSDSIIYCDLLRYKDEFIDLGSEFYAPYGFKLPEISANTISKLEIFVYDETDESTYIPLFTFSSYDEIDYFLSHYKKYISDYTSEETGALECYVYYNNYTFEEQLYEYDLDLLLN